MISAQFNQNQSNLLEVVSKYVESFGFLKIGWKPMGTLRKPWLKQQFAEFCWLKTEQKLVSKVVSATTRDSILLSETFSNQNQ